MCKNQNRFFWIIFFSLIALHLILVASLRLYPFIDLPMHLASATINRYIHEPGNDFDHYYFLKKIIARPNTFHLLFCSLKIFPGVELANKFLWCSYCILLPLSVLYLIKKINGNIWFSLLSFLLLYNFNSSWGFVGFSLSLPLIFFFLTVFHDFLIKPEKWSGFAIMLILLSLFVFHGVIALFMLLYFFLSVLFYHRGSLQKILIHSAPALPVLTLVMLWIIFKPGSSSQDSSIKGMLEYFTHEYWVTWPLRLGLLYWDNYFLFGGITGKVVASLFSVFIFTMALARPSLLKNMASAFKNRNVQFVFIFVLTGLCAYFFIPQMQGFNLTFFRFSCIVLLGTIVIGSILVPAFTRMTKPLVMVIFCAAHLILWTDYMFSFQKETRSYNPDFFPEKGTLGAMIYDSKFRDKPLYLHFPNYFIVWKHGVAVTQIVDFQVIWRIGRKASVTELPKYNEWIGVNKRFDDRYMNMNYLLTRGELPLNPVTQSYMQNFHLIKSEHSWNLYRNNQCQ